VPDSRALLCGMAIGYPDSAAPVNNYRTTREPVAGFTAWHE
jgi:nitroreductase